MPITHHQAEGTTEGLEFPWISEGHSIFIFLTVCFLVFGPQKVFCSQIKAVNEAAAIESRQNFAMSLYENV